MAKTLTPGHALSLLALRYRGLIPDGWGARMADEVFSTMWLRYPWRGTLGELPPFHLIRGMGDYKAPFAEVPVDFWSLHDAAVYSKSGYHHGLTVPKSLRVSEVAGMPASITYDKATQAFRVYPRPATGGCDWWVGGVYKKAPPKITNDNLNSFTFPWDDVYFPVFRAGLNWLVKRDIVGSVGEAREAAAEFFSLLQQMAEAENVADGHAVYIHPESGLELGG